MYLPAHVLSFVALLGLISSSAVQAGELIANCYAENGAEFPEYLKLKAYEASESTATVDFYLVNYQTNKITASLRIKDVTLERTDVTMTLSKQDVFWMDPLKTQTDDGQDNAHLGAEPGEGAHPKLMAMLEKAQGGFQAYFYCSNISPK